ncbi:MAG TPA: hypothetical protein VF928_09120 [Usitatibacteraceae bacterium]
MNVVLQSNERILLSITGEELVGLSNAINEMCNGIHIADAEFQTRLGVTREFLAGLLQQMPSAVDVTQGVTERANVWAADGAVHMLCISAFGDPVELSESEAQLFAKKLRSAIADSN